MSSSTRKGNIGSILLSITAIAILFIIGMVAQSTIIDGIPAGKYNNPNVSTYVVEGSIFDVNGKSLSIEVPVFNCYFDRTKMNTAQLELAIETISFYSGKTKEEISSVLNNTKKSYVLVAEDIDESALDELSVTLEKNGINKAVYIEKNYSRHYPAMFHASQLVAEVEDKLSGIISPRPGYDTATTYGKNVYLTIDLDIQYLLDLAVQDLYVNSPAEYIYAFVINSDNGALLGMSTYPFYDLNDENISNLQKQNKALVSKFKGINPYFINRITDADGNTVNIGTDFDTSGFDFTIDKKETVESLENPVLSVIKGAPALEKPKYYVVIGEVKPEYEIPTEQIQNAVDYVIDGLRSQSKF